MALELILKDIVDERVRENFFRIQRFISENILLGTDFKFFEVDIPQASEAYAIPHNLKFAPKDIIALSSDGDYNFYFRSDLNDSKNIYVSTNGPVRLRFLAGRYKQTGRKTLKDSQKPFVPPHAGGQTPGTGTPSPALTYTFPSPLASWVINHNLGYIPSTEVFGMNGSEIEADVANVSVNQTIISFNQPMAGFARLT